MKIIKKFVLGSAQMNSFLIEHNDEIMIIDPGENIEKVIDYLEESNLQLTRILITHAHFDHVAGLTILRNRYPKAKAYIAQAEMELLRNPQTLLATAFNSDYCYQGEIHPSEELNVTGLKVRHISGHSLNSTVYIFTEDNVVFTGDTLFNGAVGRSDFINGNQQALLGGITDHLLSLPGDTKVYPGHGFATTIEQEKTNNIFFR